MSLSMIMVGIFIVAVLFLGARISHNISAPKVEEQRTKRLQERLASRERRIGLRLRPQADKTFQSDHSRRRIRRR